MSDNKIIRYFSIKISHDFYSDNICPDFTIVPSAECRLIMKRYKMFMREIKNGIEVYYTADGSDDPIIALTSEEKFCFYLSLKNRLLYNFTDISVQNIFSNIFYLTNRQSSDTDSDILHSSSDSLGSSDLLELKPQIFSVEDTSLTRSVKFILKDINENEITQNDPIVELMEKSSPSDADTYQVLYNVNLENQKSGRYNLTLNGSDYSEFYADNMAVRNGFFGVVEIFKSNNNSKEYEIKLTGRTSYWKYIIIPKYQTDVTLSLLQINSTIDFDDVVEETLDDGTEVAVIQSESEIVFSENSTSAIKLQLKGHGNSVTTLIENLPNASPENLKYDMNTNEAYTEVFIYI